MPAKKAPSAKETPNSLVSAIGDAHRGGHHAQREELARADLLHLPQQPRKHAPADDQHQGATKHPTCSSVVPMSRQTCEASAGAAIRQHRRQRRQQHQHQHHGQVFHHQPADRDAAGEAESRQPRLSSARSSTTVLATDSAMPNTRAPPGSSPTGRPMPTPMARGHAICTMAPGMRDLAHREQVVQREMQADAEHQQHHADLGQLRGDPASATKPGVKGPMITPASR
jgi:hypothetical protein